jgi:uncharacterized membrane protein
VTTRHSLTQITKTNKRPILVLAVLWLLVLLPFWKLATGQGIVISNDIGVSDIANLQYPLRYFAGQELRHGRLPLWTPGVYMGYPLLAEGQAGVFSPVNLLLFGLLPVPEALNVGSLLPFVIAATGAFLLARELGASMAGAFLAGFSYALSGFYVGHVKHIPIVTTACWIPVVLWLVERGVRRSDGALLGAGLVMGIQWLSGSPQMAYYSAGMATVYFAGRSWQKRKERSLRRAVPMFALGLVLSLGLGAVQLLPTLELVRFSERAGGVSYDFATRFPYAIENVKTFLYPLVNGTPGTGDLRVSSIFWEDYAYLGLIPLFLGVVGGLIMAWRSGVARLLVGLTAVIFALALGPHTPLFRLAYQVVPGLGFFRFPQRLLAFVVLFVAVLAGLVWTEVERGRRRWRSRRSAIRTKDEGRRMRSRRSATRTNDERRWWMGDRALILSRVVTGIVLVLVVVDLYFYHWSWNGIVDKDVWLAPPETAQVVQERARSELYRVYTYDVYNTFRAAYREAGGWRGDLEPYVAQREFLQPSLNLIYGVPTADGYVNLVPDYLATLWGTEKQLGLMDTALASAEGELAVKEGFIKLFSAYNVRFLIAAEPVEDEALELVGVYGPGAHLYENRRVMPRAFFVPEYTVVDDVETALALMRSAGFDVGRTVVLLEGPPLSPPREAGRRSGAVLLEGEEPPLDPPREAGGRSGTVKVVDYQGARVAMEVETEGPGWLVLSDTYYPGWEATVDGEQTRIYQANGCVRAVPIEAGGRHEVVFRFRPRPFYQGALISGVSGVVWVAAWVVLKNRR